MQDLFNILERYGFVGIQDAEKVYDIPAAELEKLHNEVLTQIYAIQQQRMLTNEGDAKAAFSFHASASIRAASGCSELSCRLRKLDFLARYAALYANELSLPLGMPTDGDVHDINKLRSVLNFDLISLLFLRPVITAGVMVPVVMRSAHCIHELDWIKEVTAFVHEFSQESARHLQSAFRIRYQVPEKSPTGRPTIYFDGPEEFIEHGGLVSLLDEKPRWLPKSEFKTRKRFMTYPQQNLRNFTTKSSRKYTRYNSSAC
jgi:hypothetical protein